MGWLVVVAVVLGACYSPHFRDCEVSCSDQGCPSGLSCELGMCRLPGMSGACPSGGTDAGGDATRPDADLSCWTGITPSNFSPCDKAFPTAAGNFLINMTPAVFDTDQGTLNGAPAPGQAYDFDGPVWLIHTQTFSQNTQTNFRVIGARPLLIVSDGDITLLGIVDAGNSNTAQGACADATGTAGTGASSGAGGGGGGGNATAGGSGGADSTGARLGGAGGGAVNNAMLVPLHPGCRGGQGGDNGGAGGAKGGNGGGAIEFVSKTTITVKYTITAAGGGGAAGGMAATSTGGGGGGAGGSILLEAPAINIDMGASLCAGGGGGGQGGTPGSSGTPGGTGSCSSGMGGSTGIGGGAGGNGASLSGSGSSGLAGHLFNSQQTSGGGGGGGLGRIHLHTNSRFVDPTAIIIPADQ